MKIKAGPFVLEGPHPYLVLELLVALQLLFVETDGLTVMTAEISVVLLHLLPSLTGKLWQSKNKAKMLLGLNYTVCLAECVCTHT